MESALKKTCSSGRVLGARPDLIARMKRFFSLSIALGFAVALGLSSAHGQSPALTSITGGTTFSSFDDDGDTVGWSFTANQSIFVTALGFNDVTPLDGFFTSHDVGLWNNTGLLLGMVTVTGTETLNGGFRYVSLALPVALLAGQTYVLGAFYPANNPIQDGYITNATSITVDPAITFGDVRRDPTGPQTGLVFPTVSSGGFGRFGPNLLFTAVPEPSTFALLGLGTLGGIVAWRRRRA